MARTNTTSTSWLTAGVPIVNAYPFTIGCWLKTTSLPLSAGNQNLVCIGGLTKDDIGIYIDNATSKFGFYVGNSAGMFDVNPIGSALVNGTWYAGMFVGVSATSRTGYINGAGTTVTTNFPIGTSQTNTWLFSFESGTDNAGAFLAEVAIWNVALTAGEAAAHATGVNACRIRPNALVGYWPLYGLVLPEPDLSGNGHSFAQVSGTVAAANHAPVELWTPRRGTMAIFTTGGGGFTPKFRKTLSVYGSGIGKRQAQAV